MRCRPRRRAHDAALTTRAARGAFRCGAPPLGNGGARARQKQQRVRRWTESISTSSLSRWYHVTYARKAQGTRGRAPCRTQEGDALEAGAVAISRARAARVLMAFSNASGETRPARPDPWIRQQPRSARARARVAQSFSGAERRPSFRPGPSSNEARRGGTRAAHRRSPLLSLAGI